MVPVTGVVKSARNVAGTWVDTGLQRLIGFSMVECEGVPGKSGTKDTKKVLALGADSFTHFKNTVANCEECELQTDKFYRLCLLPGKLITAGVSEDVWIFTDTGDLAPDILCC